MPARPSWDDVDRPVVVALQVLQDLPVEVGLALAPALDPSARQQGGEAETGGEGEDDESDGEQSSSRRAYLDSAHLGVP